MQSLARELSPGHDVAILAPPSTIAHFRFDEDPGITALPWEFGTRLHPRDLLGLGRVRRTIEQFGPDVVHAHGFRAGLLTLLALRRRRFPVIVSWHNQASATGVAGKVEAVAESFVARRADLTLGASEDLVQRARDVGGRNVVFAPVAAPAPAEVDPRAVADLRSTLLEGFPPGAQVGTMVGRVAPQKNYGLLIDIAELLTDVPLHIVIAGAADDDVKAGLERRMAGLDLGQVQITFLGPRDDVTALLAASDFYLLTSHWEARALVIQEALLAGLPVIASDVGGIPGLVGDAGILIDPAAPDAPEGFARAVRDLQEPQARRRWSERARLRSAELPDEPEVARLMEQHYRDALRSR